MSLRGHRAKAGKTVKRVAEDLGVAERTYWRWEQGDTLPDAQNLIKLSDYFGVEPRELVPEPAPTSR